jgi:hypothetical protein
MGDDYSIEGLWQAGVLRAWIDGEVIKMRILITTSADLTTELSSLDIEEAVDFIRSSLQSLQADGTRK